MRWKYQRDRVRERETKARREERAGDPVVRARAKAKAKRTQQRRWPVRRFAKYGISQRDAMHMLAAQEGRCAICDALANIDHDHTTGEVRGILCGPCNSGMGMLGDDPDRLVRAAAYLRASRTSSAQ